MEFIDRLIDYPINRASLKWHPGNACHHYINKPIQIY